MIYKIAFLSLCALFFLNTVNTKSFASFQPKPQEIIVETENSQQKYCPRKELKAKY